MTIAHQLEKPMKPEYQERNRSKQIWLWKLAACLFLLAPAAFAAAQATTGAVAHSAGTAPAGPKAFATPRQAADALIAAAENFDSGLLVQIFGPDGEDIVFTGEPVRDRQMAEAFAAQAREKFSIAEDPGGTGRAFLLVGKEDWPFPVPIVKRNNQWFFDAKAGRHEILMRRIGRNELDAIQICLGYVDAQQEYALEKRQGYDVNQYARHIISTSGTQDGLVWRNPDGTLGGPIAERIATALEEGYTSRAEPYHGYYFKVLKGQGPAAPLGQMDFIIEGAMIGGFALVAAPAEYEVTGVKTFIVNQDGVVYEKDLGPDTLQVFKSMELYNPDNTWSPTEDE